MSTRTKWTPGPWRIRQNARHAPDECDLTICGGGYWIADINGPPYDHCEPNARLIAAAPEMAETLKRASAALAHMHKAAGEVGLIGTSQWDRVAGGADYWGLVDAINAALAKAEGGA